MSSLVNLIITKKLIKEYNRSKSEEDIQAGKDMGLFLVGSAIAGGAIGCFVSGTTIGAAQGSLISTVSSPFIALGAYILKEEAILTIKESIYSIKSFFNKDNEPSINSVEQINENINKIRESNNKIEKKDSLKI